MSAPGAHSNKYGILHKTVRILRYLKNIDEFEEPVKKLREKLKSEFSTRRYRLHRWSIFFKIPWNYIIFWHFGVYRRNRYCCALRCCIRLRDSGGRNALRTLKLVLLKEIEFTNCKSYVSGTIIRESMLKIRTTELSEMLMLSQETINLFQISHPLKKKARGRKSTGCPPWEYLLHVLTVYPNPCYQNLVAQFL